MLSPSVVPWDTVSSAKLLTLPLDDTRDSPMSARYNGGVEAVQNTFEHTTNCIIIIIIISYLLPTLLRDYSTFITESIKNGVKNTTKGVKNES